ncbi:energy transducer TonB [Accumulibacter sp.]|uniref:energy transducer TonB n=1 Tax=Accumulibacter sp. TaxID=2053492 RepID=UPI002D0CA44B|nr:energy transducer TonB [Accumulibacter sp.]HNM63771.1 energy transducer TonB [Accumulibacter sp.]
MAAGDDSPGSVGASAPFHALPVRKRQPWWRTSVFLILVGALHLVALLIAFGAVWRPAVPQILVPLTVRVAEPARAPSLDEPARVAPPKRVVPPKRAVPPPATHAPAPKVALARAPAVAAANSDASPALAALPAPPPTAAGEAASAPAAPAVRVAARFDADYLRNPKPVYPPAARRLGEEGRVVLRVRVSAEGMPVLVEVKQSSGFPRLDEAARTAVEHWRFVPARQGSEAIESSVLVPLQFALDG